MPGHFILAKAQAPKGRVDRVFGHRAQWRADRWKQELAGPSHSLKIAQDRDGARGERHSMRAAHFHLFRLNQPEAAVKIELRPLRRAELARTNEGQSEQFESRPSLWRTLIALDGAQKSAERLGLYDSCAVCHNWRRQRALERSRWIAFRAPRRYRVTEDLSDGSL